jgi:predicted lipoprotein with Yx(FWY)xxD motif
MNRIKTYVPLLALVAVVILVVAACGGGSDSESAAPNGETVSISTVDGVGDVLVDADGAALYAADEEADGMVLCIDSCLTIWNPLTLSDGEAPPAADGLGAMVGVLTRPDGGRQVTLEGRPLYRFIEDPGPGTVTGNGLADVFGDQAFTWHVATPTGVSTSSVNSSSSDGYDF